MKKVILTNAQSTDLEMILDHVAEENRHVYLGEVATNLSQTIKEAKEIED